MTPSELKDARKSLGLTQHGLAAVLEMGVWGWQSISAFEGGRKKISTGFADRVRALMQTGKSVKGPPHKLHTDAITAWNTRSQK